MTIYACKIRVMARVFNATFNNISIISWRSVLLVEETGVARKNRPVASHWQTLSHNVVSSTPRLSWIRTHCKHIGDMNDNKFESRNKLEQRALSSMKYVHLCHAWNINFLQNLLYFRNSKYRSHLFFSP